MNIVKTTIFLLSCLCKPTGCTVGSEEELFAGHGLVGGGGDEEAAPPDCGVFRLLRRHDFK